MDRAILSLSDDATFLNPPHYQNQKRRNLLKLAFFGIVLIMILVSFICQVHTNTNSNSARNLSESLEKNKKMVDDIMEKNQRFYRVRQIGGLIYHFSEPHLSHFGKTFAQAKSFCEDMNQHLVEFHFDTNVTSQVDSSNFRTD